MEGNSPELLAVKAKVDPRFLPPISVALRAQVARPEFCNVQCTSQCTGRAGRGRGGRPISDISNTCSQRSSPAL